MISENARYWIWISKSLGYNNIKVKRVYELYNNISDFYNGGEKEWKHCGIFTPNEISRLEKAKLLEADNVIEHCKELDYSVIALDDGQYPEKLKNIDTPPAVIYVNGKLPDFDERLSISIVGTRRATRYGTDNSFKFAYALAKYSVIVVSGGALGVDCASHRGALAANGITVCVLGCGINYKYLTENEGMRNAIAHSGAVISEYPPDEPPLRYNFPARNRIISALSDGLVVMEAGVKSGSLITARTAIDQGKEVFALLGNNSPQNEGSNTLIKEGLAHPVTDFMDVLSEFNNNRGLYVEDERLDFDSISFSDLEAVPVKGRKPNVNNSKAKINKTSEEKNNKKSEKIKAIKNSAALKSKKAESVNKTVEQGKDGQKNNISDLKASGLSEVAVRVYGAIGNEPVHIDKIVSELNIPVFKVLTALTQLEMKGYVTAMQGRRYVLK